jgi:hypothetical protein
MTYEEDGRSLLLLLLPAFGVSHNHLPFRFNPC